MPELPEVEIIRRGLSAKFLNKKILNIVVKKPRLIKNSRRIFADCLINNCFIGIERIGKLLIFYLKEEKGGKRFLLIHLKMTGQLIYEDKKILIAGGHNFPKIRMKLPNKYSHIIFDFTGGAKLFYNDLRQFGFLKLVGENELVKIKAEYGIEPLQENFVFKDFWQRLKIKKTNIKSALLNQKIISGLGNIYVDEALFAAQIRPQRLAGEISENEYKKLFLQIEKIIKKAIKNNGTTFSDYKDSSGKQGNFSRFLKVYGRGGLPCAKCKSLIIKTKLAGRGTHYCPICQK